MKNKKPSFSVLIPTYNQASVIGTTIDSVLRQTFNDFELIIVDNASTDKTAEVVKKYQEKDKRIKFFQNEKNLGYPGNLQRCCDLASGKYLYFLGSDDILSFYALEKTFNAFKMDPDVGVVTRPYYWFEGNTVNKAVRVVEPLDPNRDRLISIFDSKEVFSKVFESVGQLSGLSYRREWMKEPINKDVFTAHIYPFLAIFREHKAVFLKDQILAVRIALSLTRTTSSIYDVSPIFTWVKMFKKVLRSKKYQQPRNWGIDHISRNYVGLIQIKNYAKFPLFYRESWLMVKYRPKNLLSPRFWFYFIGLIVVPKSILIPFVDKFKRKIIGGSLRNIKLYSSSGRGKKTVTPGVTMIIPMHNSASTLVPVLKSVEMQDYPINEIFVLDNNSSDDSAAIVEKFAKKSKFKVRLIVHKKDMGLSYSYNEAIRKVKTPLFITLQSDCVITSKDGVARLIKPFLDNFETVASCSLQTTPWNIWKQYNIWQKALFSRHVGRNLSGRNGRFCCYSLKAVKKIGLFNTKAYRTAGEDGDIFYHLKQIGIITDIDLVVDHLHSMSDNFSLKTYIYKENQLAEAVGATMANNFSRTGIMSWMTAFIRPALIIGLLIPYVNIVFLALIILFAINFTKEVFLYNIRDIRTFALFFVNIFLIFSFSFYFIRGAVTRRQTL